MKNIYKIVLTLIVGVLCLVPISSSAITPPTSISSPCLSLARNLSRGSIGQDVVSLQDFLRVAGYFNNSSTGYFGSVTEQSVKSFQQDYNSSYFKNFFVGSTAAKNAIGYGKVGPLTRNVIQTLTCSGNINPVNQNASVSIKGNNLDTPVTVSSGDSVMLSWISSSANLSCSAIQPSNGDKSWSGAINPFGYQVVYPNNSAVYTISCVDTGGIVATDSVSVVVVGSTSVPYVISVDIKANGTDGPVSVGGKNVDLSWSSVNATYCTIVAPFNSGVTVQGKSNFYPSHLYYPSQQGTIYSINCYDGKGGSATDSVTVSSGTITTPPPPPATSTPPSVQHSVDIQAGTLAAGPYSNGPLVLKQGDILWFRVTGVNVLWCTTKAPLNGQVPNVGSIPVVFGYITPTNTFHYPAPGGTTYVVTCTTSSGVPVTDSVTVYPPSTTNTPPTVQVPTVDVKANNSNGPITVTSGQSVQLIWTSANTTNCIASNSWSGTKNITGNQYVYPILNSNYVLTCTGPGGSASDSVAVNIQSVSNQYSGDLKISTDGSNFVDGPITIPAPTNLSSQSIWFKWVSSYKPNNCYVIMKGGSQYSSIASNVDMYTWGPMNYGIRGYPLPTGAGITTTTVYELYCANGVYNGGPGTLMDSVTLNTAAPIQPFVDIRIQPSNTKTSVIANGEQVILSWNSSPTGMVCTGSGASFNNIATKWNGAQPGSGKVYEYPYATTKYTLSCSNSTQTLTDSVTVTVK